MNNSNNFGKLVLTNGKAKIFRSESFNHRTTALIEWIVVYTQATGKEMIAQYCKTRKEAVTWAAIYSN